MKAKSLAYYLSCITAVITIVVVTLIAYKGGNLASVAPEYTLLMFIIAIMVFSEGKADQGPGSKNSGILALALLGILMETYIGIGSDGGDIHRRFGIKSYNADAYDQHTTR